MKKRLLIITWPYAHKTVCHWRKKDGRTETYPVKINNLSQSHNNPSEIDRQEAINKEIDTVQGPTSYDEEI